MSDTKYKRDLKIDEHNIDDALLRQPQLYYEYSKEAALAKNNSDDAKDNIDIVKAEVEAEIRDSEEYHTEGAIKSAVERHRKVRVAKKKHAKLRRISSLLSKAEKAFEQRKSMLQTIVYYRVNNMNSNVKVPQQIEREMGRKVGKELGDNLKSTNIRRRNK